MVESAKKKNKMDDILIISTGGTFNKIYDPIKGELSVDTGSLAIKKIADKWLTELNLINIISKDSLDMDDNDRKLLADTISRATEQKIIVIHGTDTMDQSAKYIDEKNCDKIVVFTGAMVPYAIEAIEAASNLSSAIGYTTAIHKNGVYIAMNGIFGKHTEVTKDRKAGKFTRK